MNYWAGNLPSIYLRPGAMHLSERPSQVTTVLGSCVSVTMYSPRTRLGAICHVMLPKCKCKKHCGNGCIYHFNGECQRDCSDSFRYADCSIRKMVEDFLEYGIEAGEIEVKLFGGSDMFSLDNGKCGAIHVGKQNIETALEVIDKEGLRLSTYDVGGPYGRKIIFYTHTGEIFLKRLHGSTCELRMNQPG